MAKGKNGSDGGSSTGKGGGDDGKGDDDIGYCKPPKHTRWKKGQSGNPKGRKKGSRGLKKDLDAALKEKVTVPILGKNRKDTTQGNAMHVLAIRAAGGDMRASKQLTDLVLAVFGPGDRGQDGETKLSALDQQLLERMLAREQGSDSSEDDADKPADGDDADGETAGEQDADA